MKKSGLKVSYAYTEGSAANEIILMQMLMPAI